jgi:hypothetical protein
MSQRDLAVALARGHVALHGIEAEERRLLGAWALAALEGSRGELVYAFNFGNLPAIPRAPACVHPTAEEDGAPVRLRRFSSPTEGAHAFWSVLGTAEGATLRHLDRGRWAAFADAVTANGFHRAEPRRYRVGVTHLAEQATSMLLPRLRSEMRAALAASPPRPDSESQPLAAYSKLPLTVHVTGSMPMHPPLGS